MIFLQEVGIPLCGTLGDGRKLACDGNLAPSLILVPKIASCNPTFFRKMMTTIMKKTITDAIINAKLTNEMINTFIAQIAICSILGGWCLKSWIAFGILLLAPLTVYLFSGKVKWCRITAIIMSCIYVTGWSLAGFLLGSIFSIEASIVLCILFLFPGIAYNWCAINYFIGK